MSSPETSLVIRAFNEQAHLPRLLKRIAEQTYRDFEIIVVDSGSYDHTPEIAERHGARLVRIESRDFTFGYSLNVGVRHARGRYIGIVSAHTEPCDAAWLGELIEPLRDESVAMVYGRQLGTAASRFSEGQDFLRIFGRERLVLQPPRFFANNANSAVRRDLWEAHPFDEALTGLEDIAWAKHWMERGRQVIYEPRAAVYHIHEESWPQVRRRYFREAQAARRIGVRRPWHVATELLREGRALVQDMARAAAARRLKDTAREIALFRMNKALGTTQGLLDGAVMDDPRARQQIMFDKTYQAVVISAPGRAALGQMTLAEVKPGDVLIRVAYEGVCATDLEILDGTLGYYRSGQARYPIVPGHELSGSVVRVGPNVPNLEPGDPVVVECIQSCGVCALCQQGNPIGCKWRRELGVIDLDGGYGEYVIVPGRFVHKLPAGVALRDACLCEPLAVALKGLGRLERAWGPASQRSCAVIGGGPLGQLCARILHLRGQHVTVFDRNPRRRACLDSSGIATRSSEELAALGEYDALIEATGDPQALDAMLRHVRPGSALLLLGLPYSRREFDFETVVAHELTIAGSVGSGPEDFREAIATLPHLDLRRFTECVFPLRDFAAAWQIARTGEHLKVLLEVDPVAE
jgi:2-desacetyl-2-hydroxyethyl bacteriochlorophyllide A dehydrogenase